MSEHKKKKHKSGKSKEAKASRDLPGENPSKPAKKSPAPRGAKTTKPKAKKAAAPARRKKRTASEVVIQVETISERAYYLSEHRRARGEHGDEEGDWIEAERQLRAEASREAAGRE